MDFKIQIILHFQMNILKYLIKKKSNGLIYLNMFKLNHKKRNNKSGRNQITKKQFSLNLKSWERSE